MKIFIRILLFCSLIFCGNVFAQTDIAGTWQGKLEISPGEKMSVLFIITKQADGAYKIVLDSPDAGAVKNVPATSVAFAGNVLKVEVKSLSGSYSGTLDKGIFTGEWRQPGGALPLVLTPYEKPSSKTFKPLLGEWVGKLTPPGQTELTAVFRFEAAKDDSIAAFLDIPDQNAKGIPISDIQLEDNQLHFNIKAIQAEYTGKLSGGKMEGALKQGGIEMKLALTKGKYVAPPAAKKPPEITVSPAILEKYAGVYELSPGFNMTITLEGGQLNAQASGQGKVPIFAETETKFFYKVVDAKVEFFKDDKGAVTHLVLYQNGQEIKGQRTDKKIVERKEITVPPPILKQYVGAYELQPGFDLMITLEGGQLISQATGQEKAPLYAETETKFFLKVVDAQIEFFKDGQGAVTHLVLHQGPAEIKARRK